MGDEGFGFVSYSRDDAEYVQRLVGHLKANGVRVWFDQDILNGERWRLTVQERVEQAAAVLVVESANAQASEWVEEELLHARAKSRPLLVLVLDGDLRLGLRSRNAEFVGNGELPTDAFVARARDLLQATTAEKAAAETMTPRRMPDTSQLPSHPDRSGGVPPRPPTSARDSVTPPRIGRSGLPTIVLVVSILTGLVAIWNFILPRDLKSSTQTTPSSANTPALTTPNTNPGTTPAVLPGQTVAGPTTGGGAAGGNRGGNPPAAATTQSSPATASQHSITISPDSGDPHTAFVVTGTATYTVGTDTWVVAQWFADGEWRDQDGFLYVNSDGHLSKSDGSGGTYHLIDEAAGTVDLWYNDKYVPYVLRPGTYQVHFTYNAQLPGFDIYRTITITG